MNVRLREHAGRNFLTHLYHSIHKAISLLQKIFIRKKADKKGMTDREEEKR
jgi:hypothetical protein